MSIKALTGLVPEWYVPTDEKPEDENAEVADDATSFYCFPLTQPQVLDIQQYYDSDEKAFNPTAYARAYTIGCRNWKNVFDHEGRSLKWSPVNMNMIPAAIMAEVGAYIISISVLGEDETKN